MTYGKRWAIQRLRADWKANTICYTRRAFRRKYGPELEASEYTEEYLWECYRRGWRVPPPRIVPGGKIEGNRRRH